MNYSTEINLPYEHCFNIWFMVDIAKNISSQYIIKSYALGGTDDQKLDLLAILAESNFYYSPQFSFSELEKVLTTSGEWVHCLDASYL